TSSANARSSPARKPVSRAASGSAVGAASIVGRPYRRRQVSRVTNRLPLVTPGTHAGQRGMELGFVNLLAVTAIAFGAPLALGLVPRLRIPAVVAEIALGIAVGPNGLGWVEIDEPVDI